MVCVLWFFGLDKILREYNLDPVAIYLNYLLYILGAFILFNSFLFPYKYIKDKKLGSIYQKLTGVTFAYFFYALFQIVLNPAKSELDYFVSNYSVVLPSFSLSMFFGLTTFKSTLSLNRHLKFLVLILLFVVFYSEFLSVNIGTESKVDFRTGGIFGQANNYGYFLSVLAILISANMFQLINIFTNRVVSISLFLILLMLILRTGSYGALIVVLGAISYFYLTTISSFSTNAILSSSIALAVITSSFIYFISSIDSARVSALKTSILGGGNTTKVVEAGTFDKRLLLVYGGIDAVSKSPIIGQGLSARNFLLPGETAPRPVHNVFIVELMKGGLIGLLFYVLIYLQLWQLIKIITIKRLKKLAYVLFFYLLFIDNTLTYSTFLSMNSGVIAIAVIIILSIHEQRNLLMVKPSLATQKL